MGELKYLPRVIDRLINHSLSIVGGILVTGPRDCGKTETGKHFCNSYINLNNPKELTRIKLDSTYVLDGYTPRLIDEWQLHKPIFNLVKTEIDDRRKFGQFILSGSSAPEDDETIHSGAGRIVRITLRTMSLFESNDSSNEVDFKNLFKSKVKISGKKQFNLKFYIDKIIRGGWPRYINSSSNAAKFAIKGYIDNITNIDMRNLKSPPDNIRMIELIKALARNIGTQATLKKLANESDITYNNNGGNQLIRKYLDQLAQVYVLEELQAWKTHARSSVRILEKSKWFFVDPSIAMAILDMSYEKMMDDIRYLGLVFESLVIRDLRVYAESLGGYVYFFKDTNDYDVDAIVELPDGSWSAFEIKLGSDEGIKEGVKTLKHLRKKISIKKLKLLKSMNIITINTGSYTRPDGINIIELGNLFV